MAVGAVHSRSVLRGRHLFLARRPPVLRLVRRRAGGGNGWSSLPLRRGAAETSPPVFVALMPVGECEKRGELLSEQAGAKTARSAEQRRWLSGDVLVRHASYWREV